MSTIYPFPHKKRGAAMLQYLTSVNPERVTPSQVHRLCSAQLNIQSAYCNIARVHHAD